VRVWSRSNALAMVGVIGGAVLLAGPAQAASVAFVIDSVVVKSNSAALCDDGEVLVPAQVAAEVVDGVLSQNDSLLQTCFMRANDTDLTFFVGKNRVLVQGRELFLTHGAIRQGKFILVPIGFIAETVGTKLVRISNDRVLVERNRFAPSERTGDEHLMITVNGVPYAPETWRALPTFDRLSVSAAEVAMMLDARLKWDPELVAAVFDVDGHTLILFQGKIHALIDGRPVALSRAPVLSKQKLLVPLDDVCWVLGRSLDQTTMWAFAIGLPE